MFKENLWKTFGTMSDNERQNELNKQSLNKKGEKVLQDACLVWVHLRES